ncbi:MAG: hypothetical protein LBR67_06705 [Dysgonamonadaceae bacterium]|jgi:hypothetical protein|nr:hypothetical protein [Dysgonamonadaceae bacterium]
MKHFLLSLTILTCSLSLFAQQYDPETVKLMNIKDSVELQNAINTLLKGDEKAQTAVLTYYRVSRNEEKAQKLSETLLKKYPKGNEAAGQFLNKIYRAENFEKMEDLVKEFEQTFGANTSCSISGQRGADLAKSRSLPCSRL